ncbi:MAG: hypothetical protein KME04_17660 [Pleurocapsa minor GSE-CHR-MK-17-07R]|jgi:hypothetical protein|nr:hypothetical protein [Pleurocapsa minor GSE-CHR-MK 17-07R]
MFQSFLMGGFECSTHKLPDGRRLDLVGATLHDRHAYADYLRLQMQGIFTVREGIRWHLIEKRAGEFDFSGVLPIIQAGRALNMQVIWDVLHYGYPDDVDIFSPAFVNRYERFAAAFARLLRDETDEDAFVCPINEISFFSWAGGDSGHLNPYAAGRGSELKRQLVRAAIGGIEALWAVRPRTRIVHCDPLVHIVPNPDRPDEAHHAHGYRNAQFESWDMLSGLLQPELGGHPRYLDIMGLNYYPYNQWEYNGRTLAVTDHRYIPLHRLLQEMYDRYGRPLLIAETSVEDDLRAPWLAYIMGEVAIARSAQIPVYGVCWYPILNHPGWVDDRHCHNGLWDYVDAAALDRPIYPPLAREWVRQQHLSTIQPIPANPI